MTWHYIAGELSLLLGELQETTDDEMTALEISNLRRDAEIVPYCQLEQIASESLVLANNLCSSSLSDRDSLHFMRQLSLCSELWCFGISAGLFVEE